MSDTPVLYGFDGSTYVRTTRCVLHRKGIAYDQVPINVLEGEPQEPEHLARHPFGKVPVLDIDGVRLRETNVICRYLDESRPEPALMPGDAKGRAMSGQCMSLIDSYGYGALVGAAGYHLFPDFLGNPSAEDHRGMVANGKKLLGLLTEIKGNDPWFGGARVGLADYWLGPIMAYVSMTDHKDEMLAIGDLSDWWDRLSADEVFAATAPDLG